MTWWTYECIGHVVSEGRGSPPKKFIDVYRVIKSCTARTIDSRDENAGLSLYTSVNFESGRQLQTGEAVVSTW